MGMVASALNSLGAVHDILGEKDFALTYYGRALPILQGINNRKGEARTLLNVGSIYSISGEKETALEYYQQAISIFNKVNFILQGKWH